MVDLDELAGRAAADPPVQPSSLGALERRVRLRRRRRRLTAAVPLVVGVAAAITLPLFAGDGNEDAPVVAEQPDQDKAPPMRTNLLDLALGHDHLGPVQVGMTVEQAQEALGEDVVEKETGSGCALYRPISTPQAIEFRVDDGHIVVIQAEGVASEAGITVGDTEEAINEAYADESVVDVSLPAVRRVLVRPAPDSAHATVFVLESGGTVAGMRAGTYPEVEHYGEGCP